MSADEIIEGEVVDVTRAVAIRQPEAVGLARAPEPEAMIELASKMATALKRIVDKQGLFATINGKKFPTVEAWATIARMDNVVAREVSVVPYDDQHDQRPIVWEATVELLRLSDMAIIGRSSALCGGTDDPPWGGTPATQYKGAQPPRASHNVRSMAVTRATSRAFRQHYSWIMAIAGYEPTPAEEIRDDQPPPPPNAPGGSQPPKAPSGTATEGTAPAQGQPDGPAGVQGIVEKAPDGLRQVKVAKMGGTEHRKLEVVMKVDGRRVTAILLDDLAYSASTLELHETEVVRVLGGVIEEITWQEGKPKKKELWGATEVVVLREGVWMPASSSAPTMPLEDPPNRRSSPEPAVDPTVTAPSTPPADTTTGTKMTGVDDEIATLAVRLIEPIKFVVDNKERSAAILRAVDPTTGEIVQAVLGDDPPGEIAAQLGDATAPEWGEGSNVTFVGTWKRGWVILTAVGATTGGAG